MAIYGREKRVKSNPFLAPQAVAQREARSETQKDQSSEAERASCFRVI
jgi:hypothetical protein